MRKVRVAVAGLVAVAMMSFGAAACTPEQQVQVGTGLGQVIGFLIFAAYMNSAPPCPPAPQPCPDWGP
jgi:hypothetical protein